MARESESGLPIEPVYGPAAQAGWDPAVELGEPGAYPFTRGVSSPGAVIGMTSTLRPSTAPDQRGDGRLLEDLGVS
ncbi:hypothetical protein ACLMMR_42570, partial [Streptomyces sp. NPDC000405]